jgi:hypothetical protein
MQKAELGIRYFFPYSLFALPLLQHLFSLSLLHYIFGKRFTTLTLNHFQTDFNFILNHILMLNLSVEPEPEPQHVTAPSPPN